MFALLIFLVLILILRLALLEVAGGLINRNSTSPSIFKFC